MRKTKLELGSLEVESFETLTLAGPAAGTVFARGTAAGCDDTPPPDTNFNVHTCDFLSCGGTCLLTGGCCPPRQTAVDPTCEREPGCA